MFLSEYYVIIVLMGQCTTSYIESIHAHVLDYEYNELLCVLNAVYWIKSCISWCMCVCVCVCVLVCWLTNLPRQYWYICFTESVCVCVCVCVHYTRDNSWWKIALVIRCNQLCFQNALNLYLPYMADTSCTCMYWSYGIYCCLLDLRGYCSIRPHCALP